MTPRFKAIAALLLLKMLENIDDESDSEEFESGVEEQSESGEEIQEPGEEIGESESGGEDESDSEEEEESEHEEFPSVSLEQKIEVPKDIEFNCLIVGLCLHPQKNLIAAGTIDGPVRLYSYCKDKGNNELIVFEHHKKPCRAVSFSATGEHLFTGSNDSTIQVIDLETNSVVNKFQKPNGAPIYSLLPIDNFLLASGDDNGEIVIWDFRKQIPYTCFEESNEFISSLAVSKDKKLLLATSGEGTLSAFNFRNKKMELQSEIFDSEFLSLASVKEESKVIVGDGNGSLNIFNWGEWGNIYERYPGHPGSIDAMVAINDDVVCTGCEDGKIRAVQLYPNRFLGIVGTHNGFGVECLSVSTDKKLLVSSSHDQRIKFWDLSALEQAANAEVKGGSKRNLGKQLDRGKDFFSGLA